MRRMLSPTLSLAFVIGGLTVVYAQASSPTLYYVSTAGKDSNNGSAAAPFATIQHAIDVAGKASAGTK